MSKQQYPSPDEQELFKAILELKDKKEASNFFRDLLTTTEISEFANRWKIAGLLNEGKSYLKIAKETGTSTTTVSRVAHWLNKGMGGYKKILEKIYFIEEKEESQKDLNNKKYMKELAKASKEVKSGKGKPANKVFKELKI